MKHILILCAVLLMVFSSCENDDTIVLEQSNDTLVIINHDTVYLQNEGGSDALTLDHQIDTLVISHVSDAEGTPFITLSPSISVQYLFNETQNDPENVAFQLVIQSNPNISTREKASHKDIEFAYDAFIDAYNNTNLTPLVPAFTVWAGGHIIIDYGTPKKEASLRIDIPFSRENINSGDQLRFNVYGYIEVLYDGEVLNRYEYSLVTFESAFFEPQ